MAKVRLPLEVARTFTAGAVEIEADARDLRALLRELETRYPGISERLKQGLAVAIDGEIFQDWFMQSVGPASEVTFLPAIEGG